MLDEPLVAARDGYSAHDAATLLGEWHEVDPRPTLILGDDHRVLWSNGAARHFIRAFDGVDVVRGVLMVEDHRQHRALGGQLALATAHPHCWTLQNDAGERGVVLSIQRLGEETPVVCGVRFLEQRAPVYAHFRQVYGLTHTEDRVLHQLLSGRVASDIAQVDGGSLETVRAHIKAIYAKMDVCSREALFHTAGRFRLA